MATIDALTGAQCLALARFIETCLRRTGSTHWRTKFYECASRGQFSRYATAEDAAHLTRLAQELGPLVVCQFTTANVLVTAHDVSDLEPVSRSGC